MIASILLNLRGFDRLDRRIDRVEERFDNRMTGLDARMSRLEERMSSIESGLLKMLYDHVARIAKLEGSKSN
jgi:hypothetical protein